MLEEILNYHISLKWETSSYSSKRYKLVDLKDSNQEYQKTMRYHPVLVEVVTEVATHNCDPRRYLDANDAQRCNRNPRFFETPREALDKFRNENRSDAVAIVVVRVLDDDDVTDCRYCPEYIVYFQ